MELQKTIHSVVWVTAILALWEISSRTGLVSAYILPPFTSVLDTMLKQLVSGSLGRQVFNSLLVILEGFAISIALAFIIVILCKSSPVLESFFYTLCVIFNPLPGIALLPLVMMWFGINTGAMLALIVHGILWPLITCLLAGFKFVPQIYSEWGDNIGLSQFRKVTDIYLFCMMPYAIDGLRTGWARSWRSLIAAEMLFGMIGSLGGIGYFIFTNRAYANMNNVVAGVLIIVIISILVEIFFFKILEKYTIQKWGMSNG
jgi:NitT/TauT family transport system permease protein